MKVTSLSKRLLWCLALLAGGNAMAIETPDYTLITSDGDIEYRRYESFLVVETLITGDYGYKASGNEGFRRLFRYITGANDGGLKVAMTAPVSREAKGVKVAMTSPVAREVTEQGEVVAFMLPSKYTLATAPKPTDPRVRVREVPERLMAVVRYSGRWTDKNYEERKRVLLAGLERVDAESIGEVQSALYDAPYMPPFMRRNEVMIEVRTLPVQIAAAVTAIPLAM